MKNSTQKLLAGYIMLLCAILLTPGFSLLRIMRGFEIAKEFGYVKTVNYPFEIKFVVWGIAPYVVMVIDLLWQQIIIKRGTIISINIRSTFIATAVGLGLWFWNSIDRTGDGFGTWLVYILSPIIQIMVFGIHKIRFRLKETRI